jgi:signal transduction histidine kinase
MQWSDGMYHLFGMEPGVEVFPERYLEFVIPKDRERAEQMIHKIRKEFIPFDETMTITVAGKNKVIQIKAISFDDTGSKPVKMLGVDLDITEKRSNEAKLKQIEEQRQKEVFSAVMQAQEEERRRVAEMLHNEIGQLLTVAKLKIVNNTLEAEDLLNNAIKSVRTISFELMPPILEDFGLEFALKDMIDKKLSEANIDYNSTIKGLKVRLNPEMELTVYRITQEMLNNIIKHSKADLVEIKVVRQPHLIMIQLEDNGIGMKGGIAKDEKQGLGLKLIHNRVHLLKGNLSLSEGKERGTVVLIKIPLSDYN